jgi:SPP1 gp7 family putative phage head morphogenesis protein
MKKGIDPYLIALHNIQDSELEYIFQNEWGTYIFTPTYDIYNKAFFNNIYDNMTSWANAYNNGDDTSIFEKYMANFTQFSAAKTWEECQELQKMVFDANGVKKDFLTFQIDANAYKQQISQQWLRVEYDLAGRNAVMSEKWEQIDQAKEIYPYWKYITRHDSRVREEHAELEGKIFKIGDPSGDALHPSNGWNCRCTSESVDEGEPVSSSNAKKLLDNNVPSQFQYNPAIQGMFPKKDAPYFEDFKKAQKDKNITFTSLISLGAAKPNFTNVMYQFAKWHENHKTTGNATIFQNKKLKLNIRLYNDIARDVIKYAPVNYGLIDKCLEHPTKVYTQWENSRQQSAYFYYLLKGSPNLVCTVLNGTVVKCQDIVDSKLTNFFKNKLPVNL